MTEEFCQNSKKAAQTMQKKEKFEQQFTEDFYSN